MTLAWRLIANSDMHKYKHHSRGRSLSVTLKERPANCRAGLFERIRTGWKVIDFAHPAGRWNLIVSCTYCQRMMHDSSTECALRGIFPDRIADRRHNYHDSVDICSECLQIERVTKVCPCDSCGAFKKYSICGVFERHFGGRHIEESLCIKKQPPSTCELEIAETRLTAPWRKINSEDVAKYAGYRSYRLCVSCWNKLRPIAKRFSDLENIRLTINRVKRKIRESTKVNARTDGGSVLHHGRGNQRGCEGVGGADSAQRSDSNHRSRASGNACEGSSVCDKADLAYIAPTQCADMAQERAARGN